MSAMRVRFETCGFQGKSNDTWCAPLIFVFDEGHYAGTFAAGNTKHAMIVRSIIVDKGTVHLQTL